MSRKNTYHISGQNWHPALSHQRLRRTGVRQGLPANEQIVRFCWAPLVCQDLCLSHSVSESSRQRVEADLGDYHKVYS